MLPLPCGRSRTHCRVVADGHYLRWKAGVPCRTSSHMWGTWNLPIFLLRDGSLTLMNIVSLMVLVMLCASLPTMEKLSMFMQFPDVLSCSYMGEGAQRFSQTTWEHLNLKIIDDIIIIFGVTSRFLIVFPPQNELVLLLSQTFLTLSPSPLV